MGLFSDRTLADHTLFWRRLGGTTLNLNLSGQFFACGQKIVYGRSKKLHRPLAKKEFCVRSVGRIFYRESLT